MPLGDQKTQNGHEDYHIPSQKTVGNVHSWPGE